MIYLLEMKENKVRQPQCGTKKYDVKCYGLIENK